MAEKRTKADKEQRQANQLDNKAEDRPEQIVGKKKYARTLAERLNPVLISARGTWDKNPVKSLFAEPPF